MDVRLAVDTVLLGQVFPPLIRFSLATIIPPVFHVHLHQTKHWSARQADEATGNLKLRQQSTVKWGQWKQKHLMNVSPNMVGLKCKTLQSPPPLFVDEAWRKFCYAILHIKFSGRLSKRAAIHVGTNFQETDHVSTEICNSHVDKIKYIKLYVFCTGVTSSHLVYLPGDSRKLLMLSHVIQIKAVQCSWSTGAELPPACSTLHMK